MKKILFALCVAIVAVNSGCSDFLGTVPDNRTKIDNIEKIKALLVSAYPERTYALLTEPRCDGFEDFGSTFQGTQPEAIMDCTYTAFRWDEYARSESGNDTHEFYWMSCYEAIAAANHALAALEEIGDKPEYAPYKAEALLCRAYAHFMLLSLYSNMFEAGNEGTNPGIPYVTEPETVVIKQYDRGTVASTLEHIRIDLEAGLSAAGATVDFDQPKFHFTRNAALAFAVRFSLFTRDYPAVIAYANQLLPSVSEHTTLATTNGDGSPIEIPSVTDAAALYARSNLYDWVAARSTYTSVNAWGQAFSSPKNNNVLLASEVASYVCYANYGTAYTRYALGRSASLDITLYNPTGLNWVMPSITYTGDSSYWIPKYFPDPRIVNIATGAGILYCKIALFRLEEVLLSRAEAYAMTGEYAKALDDLNIFTQNRLSGYSAETAALYKDKLVSYYSTTIGSSSSFLNSLYNAGRFSAVSTSAEGRFQRALLLVCLDFRRIEYLHEGMRWFDILRWNIPVTHTLLTGESSTLTPADDRRVIQIPQTASLSGIEPNRMSNIPYPW